MNTPIATYRTESGRLVLLRDLGPEQGTYQECGPRTCWMAMRADVALSMIRSRGLGASLRIFVPGVNARHDRSRKNYFRS